MSKKHIFTLDKVLKKLGIIPTYTELSVFFSLYALLLLVIFIPSVRALMFNQSLHLLIREPRGIIALVIFVFATLFTVYYTFHFKKTPPPLERLCMITLAIMIELTIAITLIATLNEHRSLLSQVLIWMNGLHAFLLLILFRTDVINEDTLLPENGKPAEVMIGMIAVTIVFALSHWIWHLHPALTLSLCVSYAMIINDVIVKPFLPKEEKKQPSIEIHS